MQDRELARKLVRSYIPVGCRRAAIQGVISEMLHPFFGIFLGKKTLIFKMGLDLGRVTLKL